MNRDFIARFYDIAGNEIARVSMPGPYMQLAELNGHHYVWNGSLPPKYHEVEICHVSENLFKCPTCRVWSEPQDVGTDICEECEKRLNTKMMNEKPIWACNKWGGYEHDWLDCPECLIQYEVYIERENWMNVEDSDQ